jgi:glycosyltransferase involved in cell wall biosynthesis
MEKPPKIILILNPLKDIAHLGLTTHVLNTFPTFPSGDFISYGFFNNPSFETGSLHCLPWRGGVRGILDEIRWMRKLKPDVLYGTGTITELFYFLFRPHKAKYIVAWHGPYDKKWLLGIGNYSVRAYISYWVASYLLSRADLLACDTEFIAKSLRRAFPNKILVITLNGMDPIFYNPAKCDPQWLSQKFSISVGRPVFVFVGHLIRRKRPEIFVELARRMPDSTFLMVGREGYYTASNIKDWQKKAPNLQWIPSSLTREEMPILLASVAGLVFPSLEEPFGFAVIEAMGSGAVVVATKSGSLPEIIDDGREGFLINEGPDEVNDYFDTLKVLAKGGAEIEKIRIAARVKTEKVFYWAAVARRYEDAVRSLFEPI